MPSPSARDLLIARGVRCTPPRIAIARLLLEGPPRHVTAEQLHDELARSGHPVALATVYNTLHHLCAAGLLAPLHVERGRSWFDTDPRPHHHLLHEDTGEITDIPLLDLPLPRLPEGTELVRADLIVRVRGR